MKLVATVVILTLFTAGAISAQPQVPSIPCAKHEVILKTLETRHGEKVFADASMGPYGIEFLISSSRSWSVVVTSPGGELSCIVLGGEGLTLHKIVPPERES